MTDNPTTTVYEIERLRQENAELIEQQAGAVREVKGMAALVRKYCGENAKLREALVTVAGGHYESVGYARMQARAALGNAMSRHQAGK